MTLRIIHAALLMGCLAFAVIAVVLRQQQAAPPVDPPVVSMIGIGISVVAAASYLIVPNLMVAGWRRRVAQTESADTGSADGRFWDVLNTHFIVGAALLEGVIFFLLVAYLIEGQPWTLGVAAFFWLVLASRYPTEAGMRRWLETQLELIEQGRRGGL
jgi:hypothetical protein